MSDEFAALTEAVERVLGDTLGQPHEQSAASTAQVWSALQGIGMTLVGVPEAADGSGGGLQHAARVLAAAAAWGAPVPLAENTWLAAWLLEAGKQPVPHELLTAAVAGDEVLVTRTGDGIELTGRVSRVPFARDCASMVLLLDQAQGNAVAVVDLPQASIAPGSNIAGEPRDDVVLDGVTVPADRVVEPMSVGAAQFRTRATAARLVQLAGAARRAQALTVEHVNTRVQFGRTLSRFQAVQHRGASIAAQVRLIESAAARAVAAVEEAADNAELVVATSMATSYDAAAEISQHAHLLLGAMGFTTEHALHRATTRLWAWRQELGGLRPRLSVIADATLRPDGPDTWELLTR